MSSGSALPETGDFFRRGNYAPVADELTAYDLPTRGAIPPELNGWYLRNGPNPREAAGHWFTGEGMIHGVRIEDGAAKWYRNRWVRTDSFDADIPVYNPDGTRNLRSAVANTHVVNHAGRTLALVESSFPYEIGRELETLGAYDFGGKLTDSMTAHPKICPTTGEMHFFGYGSLVAPYVTYHRVAADGELIIDRPVEVGALTMMHDFAMTAEHVIFMDLPVVFDIDIATKGEGQMPYRWSDEYGARLGVLRRDDPFGEIRWFEIDPCYVFHVANAFDSTNSVVLQAVRYPELWRNDGGFAEQAVMWEWRIDLDRAVVAERQIDDRAVEFPRIDDRLAGLPARYAVSVGQAELVRHDLGTGSAVTHSFGSSVSGEAVFVPGPGPADESNGWYISYVYDPTRDGSELVILDASDFAGDPVATVMLPQRVPFGFHGNWIEA
ncbi:MULTISPECIES: carotenoid oxygenase family protein [Mycobacteriaceae]|uniref:Dioxygenase n=1 Tax=Mycolicibacterium neoaurum VKM Ac-1815D TaxID=700508 RepID=V5XGX8_MYCNE|nr:MULTISPECIES: carotenoid oxygenase family protein [Mycobacteriaceae]AHC27695.1 9-cis-epoxycarotenoid dioxygenase [Mycolicibacterium neoaurum VKM Ac-1815D]AMO08676.1 9-cis-epoxycarotenoid dioxygenase [Mycolicibacterium neoaurum]AXK78749.1 9-cis-epoxycarotenoid dioxygenase [Mycolicibacterium neoaurum]KJQ49777.1 9-cis-epoxycarotenoid dioxygenase [Mycolicibacterium neoaurum]KUM07262.1 9-cis-epoxycarotenoid dioxygenase [Mycolicibacterium neoaurum]